MVPAAPVLPRVEEDRYLTPLRAANAIATCSDCSSASETLARELREVTPFDFLHVAAFDKETSLPCWSLLEANRARINLPEDLVNTEDLPVLCAYESGRTLTIHDWSRETRFKRYGEFLASLNIASTCTVPLTRGSRRLGVLSLGR